MKIQNIKIVNGKEFLKELEIGNTDIVADNYIYIIDTDISNEDLIRLCRDQLPEEKKHLVIGVDFKKAGYQKI